MKSFYPLYFSLKREIILTVLFCLSISSILALKSDNSKECIIFLHGFGDVKYSMSWLENKCKDEGYNTVNIGYSHFGRDVEAISEKRLQKKVQKCVDSGYERIHFVTHSMGGLIVRYYLQNNEIPKGSRIVMLSPPNHGSEVADSLKTNFFYKFFGGKVGKELRTDSELIEKLRDVKYEIGVITGNKSYNKSFSKMIPGDDDGRVSTERAKLNEMKDFLVVNDSHLTIKYDKYVANQTIYFLQNGSFDWKR
jgi:triacylglycerol lipase